MWLPIETIKHTLPLVTPQLSQVYDWKKSGNVISAVRFPLIFSLITISKISILLSFFPKSSNPGPLNMYLILNKLFNSRGGLMFDTNIWKSFKPLFICEPLEPFLGVLAVKRFVFFNIYQINFWCINWLI